MSKWIFALIQFFPLSIFALFAFWFGAPSNERWLEAFQLGALLGLIQLAVLLPLSNPLNRLVLAGNIYLILGGLAVFFNQWWFMQLYDSLRESAILILMVIIGVVTTFASSSGFIGVKGSARMFSLYLLTATILMLPFSIYFEGDRIYAAVLPIVFLALLNRYFSFMAREKLTAKNVSCLT
ncbi:hypothetical protein ACUR5C_00590 [Aliikangiella sp. IMCC44653]